MVARQKFRLTLQRSNMDNNECILCGSCVDNCPNRVISYTWKRPVKTVD